MFLRNKNQYDDATTNVLMNKGIYSVHYPEEKPSRWWIDWKEHNLLSGMWYVFILSCLLWWLPVFGQMIAGYIGGRRAGSPRKGLLVATIPVFILMFIFIGMDIGLFPFLVSLAQFPSMVMNGIQGVSPNAASYINGIFEGLKPLVGLNANGFLIVVVFGLIGGMMADMNKKEISKATGGGNMFGGFSPASLHKLADMVAERVLWTMSTMEAGGRRMISTSHSAPREMGFADLKMLPASPTAYTPQSSWQEPVSNEPPQSFEYEDPYSEEDRFDTMENLVIESEPVESQPRENTSYDDDWGIAHYDLTDESLTEKWIAQNKNMDSQKPRKKFGRSKDSRSERLYDDEIEIRSGDEKRDAMVYHGRGNVIGAKSSKPKKKKAKPKSSSLIDRAMLADKKIEAKQNKKPKKQKPEIEAEPEPEVDPEQEALEQILAQTAAKPKPKPVGQSFERL